MLQPVCLGLDNYFNVIAYEYNEWKTESQLCFTSIGNYICTCILLFPVVLSDCPRDNKSLLLHDLVPEDASPAALRPRDELFNLMLPNFCSTLVRSDTR